MYTQPHSYKPKYRSCYYVDDRLADTMQRKRNAAFTRPFHTNCFENKRAVPRGGYKGQAFCPWYPYSRTEVSREIGNVRRLHTYFPHATLKWFRVKTLAPHPPLVLAFNSANSGCSHHTKVTSRKQRCPSQAPSAIFNEWYYRVSC